MTNLFDGFDLDGLELPNRIVMSARKITDAVHDAGGRIHGQLGRGPDTAPKSE